jgi:hypothetical protein
MSSVTDRMLSRFAVVYGEPRTGDLEAFFAEYEKAMRGTRIDILEAATDEILKSHEKRSWPTIGECRKAIEAVAGEIERKKAVEQKPPSGFQLSVVQTVTEESKARCRSLVAELKANVAKHNDITEPKRGLRRMNRDDWNARRVVGVTRHGHPIRKDTNEA